MEVIVIVIPPVSPRVNPDFCEKKILEGFTRIKRAIILVIFKHMDIPLGGQILALVKKILERFTRIRRAILLVIYKRMDIPLGGEIMAFVKSVLEGFTRNEGYTRGITVL